MNTDTPRTYPDPATEHRWAVLEGANPAGEVVVSVHDTAEEAMATLRQLVHLAPTATTRADLFVGTVEHYHELPAPTPDQAAVGWATVTSATATAYRHSGNTTMLDDVWTFDELHEFITDHDFTFSTDSVEVTEPGRELTYVDNDGVGNHRRCWAELDELVAVCAISKDGEVTVLSIDEHYDDHRHTAPDGTETVVEVPATTLHRDGEPTLADLARAGHEVPAWAIDEDGWATELDPLPARRPAIDEVGGLDL